ncbi:MAG: hypothetical protein LBR33_11465 [Propionibacteriaceae bacterium]|jgi:hypothetical protein|nr:hypothetical protein [Propionibacteriaceae bacterium]
MGHSWWRSAVAVTAGAAVTLAGVTACTGDAASGDDALTFASAPGEDVTAALQAQMATLGIVASADTTRTDRYGTYSPLTLESGAAAYSFDPTSVTTDATGETTYDLEDVEAAWEVVANYLVTEWADSELVWDDSAANRATVVDRLSTEGYFALIDTPFADLLELDGGGLTPTLLGPWVLDQDYEDWRQTGITDVASDTAADQLNHDVFAAGLVNATPAKYQAGVPRTYVTDLAPLAVQASSTGSFILWAGITVVRPIVVKNIDTPRYETLTAYLAFDIQATSGYAIISGFVSASLNVRDEVWVAATDVAQAAVLAEAAAGQGSTAVDGWALTLPADATRDADSSCAETAPDDWTGTYATYDLTAISEDTPACLELWSFPSDAPTDYIDLILFPTSTVWRLDNGGVFGTVTVESTPLNDTVTIMALDGTGRRLTVQADVPSGTGKDWAAAVAPTIGRG